MRLERAVCRIRENARGVIASACAAFMLCALPLLFHDAFFDINRFKVNAVCAVMPWTLAAFLIALAIRPRRMSMGSAVTGVKSSALSMAAFASVCVISSARTGFEAATLTGSEGRYCGLYFLLSCAAAFFIIASGTARRLPVDTTVICCAAAVAALGIANALGIDPLGFYLRIRKDQQALFLSTIGNTDFFGAYLVMLFPLAGARFVHSRMHSGKRSGKERLGSLLLALLMLLGVAASRTDSPFFALHFACAVLFAFSGDDWGRMGRSLALWGACWLAFPVMRLLFMLNGADFSGLMLLLCKRPIALAVGMVFLAAAYLCARKERAGGAAPGRRRLALFTGAVLGAALLTLMGAIAYFSLLNTQCELGTMASLLRFDDGWGSRRGFVYVRSLRAFADYSAADKLFGRGIDLTQRCLTPYFDNQAMLAHGAFNDAHCQPLQMLLTCGLAGMLAFLALYISTIRAVARHAGEDALLLGSLASLAGYGVIMLVNVTQPILIATYLSLCALALSRIRHLKEDSSHEP